MAVTYQLNGNGATKTAYIKNMGWHFARYNNTPYPDAPLYCIEPYRSFGSEVKIIMPYDVNAIWIQEGKDMVTLLTCHPYASGGKQRYLVFCERWEGDNESGG